MKNNNENFLKLCEIILAIGNFLNSGTRNGNTNGFSIRTLSKIKDYKVRFFLHLQPQDSIVSVLSRFVLAHI